ncbi:MAG: site-specific DNA-methyltransferase [FCB group bacterium]|nr:site-specific DNA-methyltransferase [FCB group bacterium]
MSRLKDLSKDELISIIAKQDKELKTKKYGLVWDSEREPEQVVLDCENNLPILKRIKSKEIKTNDTDDNILIEGDNYHSLTVLNYTHKEKIDVIYIDPPYNTGKKDFIYNDHFVEKEDGFRHSKWLNFMEKRLNLAKNLLKNNGVIFISIDDNEFAQLKLLCDKIFNGSNFKNSNFIGCLPTIMNLKGNNDDFGFSGTHEYTLVYAKNKEHCVINQFDITEQELEQWKEDEYGFYKKADTLRRTGQDAPREKRPKGWFPVFISIENQKIYVTENDNPQSEDDLILYPINSRNEEMSWSWGKGKITEDNHNLIITGSTEKGFNIYKKQRPQLGEIPTKKPKTIFYKPEYSNSTATNKLKIIFGEKKFDTPKPLKLIKDFVYLGGNKDSIILDFMAGSGTTGHAVLQLNNEDGGNRRFILCTNNENNICSDVCFPRINKIIKGYKKNSNGDKVDGLNGNLQYFKTALLKKSNNRDQLKINLTQKCTEMLCVKENIFNQEIVENDFKIFSSNKKNKFLCIYFNFIDDSFDQFIKELKQINSNKIIYMFAFDNIVDKSLFSNIKNYKIETIPQKILDIYKQLVKMNIPVKSNIIFTEFNKAKIKIFTDKEKDEGARILRIVLEKLIQKISQENEISILNPRGKEEKISTLNDKMKRDNIISQIEWEENKTFMVIGNHASHGEYEEYNLKKVEIFYKHIQNLLNRFDI